MTRPVDPPKSAQSGMADAATFQRQAREAAALRENLRRRKQQVRARQRPDATEVDADLQPPDLPGPPD